MRARLAHGRCLGLFVRPAGSLSRGGGGEKGESVGSVEAPRGGRVSGPGEMAGFSQN